MGRAPTWTDHQGSIEGLPFILIMVSLILAATLTLAGSAFQTYSRQVAESQIARQVEALESSARTVFLGGLGGSRAVHMELPARLYNMTIGGDPTEGIGRASLVTWSVHEGPLHRITVLAQGRSVPMNGSSEFSGGAVALSAGSYDLLLVKMLSDKDLNGDDAENDFYVQIRFGATYA